MRPFPTLSPSLPKVEKSRFLYVAYQAPSRGGSTASGTRPLAQPSNPAKHETNLLFLERDLARAVTPSNPLTP